MHHSPVPNLQPRESTPRIAPSDALPRWEQIPRQPQHELIIALTAIWVKPGPAHPRAGTLSLVESIQPAPACVLAGGKWEHSGQKPACEDAGRSSRGATDGQCASPRPWPALEKARKVEYNPRYRQVNN